MSRRLTAEEIVRRGNAGRLSQADIKRRAAAESTTGPGEPPRPQGLPFTVRRAWNTLVVELSARRVLSRSDGPLLLELIEARRTKNKSRAAEIKATFDGRQPLADTPAPVAPQPAAATPQPAPPASALDCAAVAIQYALDVTTGVVVAGKLVKQAAQRFLDDLANGSDRGITFDRAAAQHVVDYLSRLSLGTLMPWQLFVLANLYGFKRANGNRRFRLAYIEVAKKSGKSSLLGALALYHADPDGDGEPRAGVYMAATTRYQSASICFKEALRLRAASPDLCERSEAFKAAITFGDSTCEPLAANSEKLNGLNISFGILDELGDHATPDLFNVFNSSSVSRRQPLLIGITTAGHSRENIAWWQRQRALQSLDTTAPDDAFFAFIATLDDGDDPFDEAVWPKANVSLGITVGVENIRDAAATAKAIPSTKHSYLRFNMNVWPSVTVSSWIDANDLLKVGNAAINDEELKLCAEERIRNAEQRLAGRPCVAGLDLAIVGDLSALAMIFPPLDEDGVFECLFRVWCPEEDIVRRSKEQRVPYESWRDQGFLIATPGETTDFKFIRHEILALRDKFRISELGFDIHLADDLAADLRHEGMEVTQVGQGFHLDPAIRRIEKLIKQQKFCIHGAPIAAWCFTNVALDHGTRDVRLDKKKAREKIDAAAAACTAMFAFLKSPPRPANPYDTRGIIFLDDLRAPGQIDEDAANAKKYPKVDLDQMGRG